MVILHRRYNDGAGRCFVNVYSSEFPRGLQYLAHPGGKGFSGSTYGWRRGDAHWPSHRVRRSIFRLPLSDIWLESMVVGTCPYGYGHIALIQCLFPHPRCDIELWSYNYFTSMCSSLAICDRSSTPTIKVGYCFPTWWNYELLSMTYRHSDREGERCNHITFSLLFGIAGFLLAMSTMNNIIRYSSLWVSSSFL